VDIVALYKQTNKQQQTFIQYVRNCRIINPEVGCKNKYSMMKYLKFDQLNLVD